MQGRLFLIHPRQRHEGVDQLRQLFRLRLRLVDPFLLTVSISKTFRLVAMTVMGVFSSWLASVINCFWRSDACTTGVDRAARAKHHNDIHQRDAVGHGGQRHQRNLPHGAHFLIIVQENCHPAVLAVVHNAVLVAPRVAVALAVLQRKRQVFSDVILRRGGDLVQIRLDEISVSVIAQDEIARGEGRFLRELSVRASLRRLAVRHGLAWCPGCRK